MEPKQQGKSKKIDLSKLQNNYFEASVANVNQANNAIKSAQNWLLILGLAEMSFLGAILIRSEEPNLSIKFILGILLISFILFIIGSVKQYKHLLSSARYYDKLSNSTLSKMESDEIYVDKIPKEIKIDKKQIKSDKWANIFLYSSFVLILITTLVLAVFILFYEN